MDIFGLRIFVEVQYDIFKILSPINIYRSLPSKSNSKLQITWITWHTTLGVPYMDKGLYTCLT